MVVVAASSDLDEATAVSESFLYLSDSGKATTSPGRPIVMGIAGGTAISQ